ncbi:hypothetical protein CR513_46533, partial [Mucuna pruriens]
MGLVTPIDSLCETQRKDSCKLGEFLSAALCHQIGGALLVFLVSYNLRIIRVAFSPSEWYQSSLMSRMGIKFEDEILGLLLLNSLLESWETFKVSITNSAPNGVVSLQMVKRSVLNEEMRRKA